MAKVGNETKLVLRLAKEKVSQLTKMHKTMVSDDKYWNGYHSGYMAGMLEVTSILDSIIRELESN
jgi:hypothetical protein